MKCNNFQKRLSAYIDNNMSDVERLDVETHLRDCAKCSSEYEAFKLMQTEASKLEKAKAPEYLWENIEAQLYAQKEGIFIKISNKFSKLKEKIKGSLRIPIRVIRIAGFATILLMGVVIARYFFPSILHDDFHSKAINEKVNYQLINQRTGKYIEKSKILLLGIINFDDTQEARIDLSKEKRISNQLIHEAAFLKENLPHRRNERIKQLVSDLELILLEIANIEEQEDIENIELIKSGIDRKGLLLKINLHEISDEPVKQESTVIRDIL